MFEQLPSIWKRDEPTEREARFARRLFWITLAFGAGVMIAKVVARSLGH